MVNITIDRDRDKRPVGFRTLGHAEYADAGQDIVCAAISVLTINTVNSVDILTGDAFKLDVSEETGAVDFRLTGEISEEAVLLLRSMILGLEEIRKEYGEEFLSLNYREV